MFFFPYYFFPIPHTNSIMSTVILPSLGEDAEKEAKAKIVEQLGEVRII